MGAIANRVNEFWSPLDFARAIDAELEALRNEIKSIDIESILFRSKIKELSQEIQDLKGQVSGIVLGLKEEEPYEDKPEPELQRGDVISYIADSSMLGRMKGDKVLGIFHHQSDVAAVWGHYQQPDGAFKKALNFMPRERITLELRPEK